jgi:hypothetical protein
VLPLRGVVADIVTTNIYILGADEVEDEDVYLASNSARIDGTIEGDLVVSTGTLLLSGTVTGDVFVLSQGNVEVSGDVGGSLRGVARDVVVSGSVGDDVTIVAVGTRISGTVSRDALVFGGLLEMKGAVERDVKGRVLTAVFDGDVGHDIDIAVGNLTLDGSTVVVGDVLYRSGSAADIASTAEVGGQLAQLPARGSWATELVLTIATIIGFFGFLFGGVVLLWLFRRTAPRAVDSVLTRPLRAAGVGLAALVVAPVLVAILVMTLVGVPVAVALLVLMLLALVFGPVPAVTAIGSKLLQGRWGLFGAFFVGAVIWRLGIWSIPLLGAAFYLGGLVFGLGGWVVAIWEHRRETPIEADLLPRAKPKPEPATIPSPVGWDAPLAPGSRRDAAEDADDAADDDAEPEP